MTPILLSSHTLRLQRGFNLVELMVALVIGLVVSLVATVAYITGFEAQTTQNDLAREDEAARFAFMLLGAELGKAGYHNGEGLFPGKRFGTLSSAVVPLTYAVVGKADGTADNNDSDSVEVGYFGDNDYSKPTTDTADGRILDCLGNAIPQDMRVRARLYVAADAANANTPSLFCEMAYYPGPGSAAVPACATNAVADGGKACDGVALIPGVEVLKLVYGEDTDEDGVINRYVTYPNIANAERVLNVIAALVMRSEGTMKGNLDATAKTIDLMGASFETNAGDKGFTYTTPVDGRYRYQYSSSFTLRNTGEMPSTRSKGPV